MISSASNQCAECSKPLVGRIDKKFCDSYCKSAYHNRRSRELDQSVRNVNLILRNNRAILKSLLPAEGKIVLARKELADRGFHFGHFTSQFHTRTKLYYFTYDLGFAPITTPTNQQKVLIVRWQPYMHRPFDPWAAEQ